MENFKYLGAIISNEGSKPEILSRIAQTTAALSRLKIIWRDKNISLALFVCLCWSFTAQSTTRSCRAGQLIVAQFLGRLRPSKRLTSTK